MSGTTTRLQLPYPGPSDGPDGADVPYWAQLLAEALDDAALYGQGILSNRPVSTAGSPGIAGRLYFVIGDSTTANDGVLWLDYGTGWIQLNAPGTIIDLLANQPAAAAVPAGTAFFATDQVAEYLSNGTSWIRTSQPAGAGALCFGVAADAGYILLQGQAWPATTGIYADLYAKLGGTNLPDFGQKVPVGFKTSDFDFGTLLAAGGEKKHTLTVAELPAHHHTFRDPGASLGTGGAGGVSGPNSTQNTGNAGGDLSHNNLQPFLVVNFQAKL